MAQLVASMSGVVLGGVVEVVGSNLARGKNFTASIGSVDSRYIHQLVASMSGVVLGSVVEVVGSNLARGKIFTAYISSVDSLYIPPYIG